MSIESTHAIVFHEVGGPSVLKWESRPLETPGLGEVQLRHTAIGINFIDVYDRTGHYPRALPAVLGREAAGVITALGTGVRGFKVGQRVAYVTTAAGAYSEARTIAAGSLVKLPSKISDEQAAVLMLKGLTAEYLLRRTHRVTRGEYLVIHAAAGGVGSLLTQWGRTLGAKIIGVVVAGKAGRNGTLKLLHELVKAGGPNGLPHGNDGLRALPWGYMPDLDHA